MSSPARQCISVDLPEPDAPMIAVNCGAGEADGHAVQGPDGGVAAAVHLDQVDGGDGRHRVGGRGRYWVLIGHVLFSRETATERIVLAAGRPAHRPAAGHRRAMWICLSADG